MSSQVKALEPLKSSGFTFGANGFVVNGIKREDNASLRRLLFTDEIKGKIAQRYARQNADKTINKKWTAAQLKHYGIKFKSSEKAEDLQVLLRDQVRQGMVTESCIYLFPRRFVTDIHVLHSALPFHQQLRLLRIL